MFQFMLYIDSTKDTNLSIYNNIGINIYPWKINDTNIIMKNIIKSIYKLYW